MTFLTDITAENYLRQETLGDQKRNVAHANFIGRITVAKITNIIDAEEYTFPGNSHQLRRIVPVAKMADRNSVGRHVFFPEQCDLFHRELAEMSGVCHHACAGPLVGSRRSAKYAFLGRSNMLA